MDYKYKLLAFKCLELIPARISDALYNQLQAFLGNRNAYKSLKSTRKTLTNFDEVISHVYGASFNSALEIGSGWFPSLPYILKFEKKLNKIHTYGSCLKMICLNSNQNERKS